MFKKVIIMLIFIFLISGLIMANDDHPKTPKEETDAKAFKILKERSIDPKTGLPRTLDPNLFKGETKQAYQIAREIPAILALMPCFCECDVFGHENLLDCFIDLHGAG